MKALKEFDENETVLVFSDDPDWCNEQELFADDRFMIAEGNSGWTDMCLMTMWVISLLIVLFPGHG